MAVICQLWCWLGPLLVLPLVVRFTVARRNAFLRAVTGEVLNLQLVAAVPLAAGLLAIRGSAETTALVFWGCLVTVAAYGYVVGFLGAVHAWRGTAWPYPLNVRVISR